MSGAFGAGRGITNTEPRIGSLQLQQSSQGVPIQLVWGRNRVFPNLMWFDDFKAIEHRDSQAAGKGGGTTITSVTYTYTASLMLALGAGMMTDVVTVWRHKDKLGATIKTLPGGNTSEVWILPPSNVITLAGAARWTATTGVTDSTGAAVTDYTAAAGSYTFGASVAVGETLTIGYNTAGVTQALNALQVAGFTTFSGGAVGQAVWSYLTTAHALQAISYSGIAYVAATQFTLGGAAGLPQLSFEVNGRRQVGGGNVDANPADIATDLLTDPIYGAGFPAAQMDAFTDYRAWCSAAGLFFSPVWAERKGVFEYIAALAKITHSRPLWSVNKLKLIPMTTEVTGGYTPAAEYSAPVYALTDDDFKEAIDETRAAPSDRFNRVSVQYKNRDLDYAIAVESAEDRASIDAFGLIEAPDVLKAEEIASPAVAPIVCELLLREFMTQGGEYRFTIPINYDLLEPLDIVQIQDARINLDPRAVRILEITEAGDDGSLAIVAEDVRVTGSVVQTRQTGSGYTYPGTPPDAASLLAVMMPTALTGNIQQLWIGVSAGDNWGGSSIWVSATGSDYRRVADVSERARMGTLAGATPAATTEVNPAQAFDVSMTGSATIASVSQVDCNANRSLLWVNGEILGYRDATLTAAHRYSLNYLRRALYGTNAPAHIAGEPWLRLDEAITQLNVKPGDIGTTLFIKVTSRNALGTYLQGLEEVAATQITLTARPSAPDAVNGLALTTPFVSTYFEVTWSASPRASDYAVESRDLAGVLKRMIYTSAPVVRYQYADAQDDGGALRSYTVTVRGRNTGGTAPPTTLTVTNPAPAATTGVAASGMGTIRTFNWTASTASDVAGYLGRFSTTTGFDPTASAGTAFYDGNAATATLSGLIVGTTYYIRIAAYDVWDKKPAGLNWSAQYSFTA